jgi:ATP-dependent DNA helicase RecG
VTPLTGASDQPVVQTAVGPEQQLVTANSSVAPVDIEPTDLLSAVSPSGPRVVPDAAQPSYDPSVTDVFDVLTLQERVRTTIRLSESHFREFKSAQEGAPGAKNPRDAKLIKRDIGETLVAFANADGGELLVGVEDDGIILGVPHTQDQVQQFLDAWRTHVHTKTPLPKPAAVQIELDGKTVLYFSVAKGSEFVYLTQDGRCLQRKDRESIPVPSEDIRFERQERASREYDRTFVEGADASALDLEAVIAVGNQVAPGLSPEKVLQLLGLADFNQSGLQLRRAAMLLFAKDVSRWHPRCEARLLRVSGTELRTGREYNVLSDTQIVGNVLELLQAAWDGIRPFLVETRLGPDGRFQEQVRYPEDACREALTNALAHRDYTIEGRAIEVYVFDDRLEVKSPGSLLSTVTIEGLRRFEGVHQSRNTTVARTLRELGYMREMGEGFRRIFQLMKAHDLMEPDFAADSQSFSISLRHQSIFSQEDQRWISGFEDFPLERDEEKVLLLGRTGHTLSIQQIMDAVDLVDTEDYRALIERLQLKGLIEGVRRPRTGVRTRNSPRWSVLQPNVAAAHYDDLIRATAKICNGSRSIARDLPSVSDLMSNSNPIRSIGRSLLRSLAAFGLTDVNGFPTVKLLQYTAMHKPTPTPKPKSPIPITAGAPRDAITSDVDDLSDLAIVDEIAQERQPTRIFVGSLDYSISESDLRSFFQQFGDVTSVSVPQSVEFTNENRGYAFVEFRDRSQAEAAKNGAEGKLLGGRAIHVDWASSGRSRR